VSAVLLCSSPPRPYQLWDASSLLSGGYQGLFPWGKAAGAWSWPLTSIYCRSQECVELYLHSPDTPSWNCARLKHRDNFILTYLTLSVFPIYMNFARFSTDFLVIKEYGFVLHSGDVTTIYLVLSAFIPWPTSLRAYNRVSVFVLYSFHIFTQYINIVSVDQELMYFIYLHSFLMAFSKVKLKNSGIKPHHVSNHSE
jgi:hypothetical protein